jgi:hypothetical protein
MLVCYTGHTQKNGAVSIVFTIETAPLFGVCPVYVRIMEITSIFDMRLIVIAACTINWCL